MYGDVRGRADRGAEGKGDVWTKENTSVCRGRQLEIVPTRGTQFTQPSSLYFNISLNTYPV